MSSLSIVKYAGIYGAADIVAKIIAMVTMPLFTRYFSLEEYGQIALISTIVSLLTAFGNPGVSSAVHRFYGDCPSEREKKTLVTTGLVCTVLAIVLSNFVVIAAGFLFLESAGRIANIPLYLIAFALIASLPAPVIQYAQDILRLNFKAKQFMVVAMVRVVLAALLAVIFAIFLNGGLIGFFAGAGVALLSALIISMWYLHFDARIGFEFNVAKRVFIYGFPLLISGLVTLIMTLSDRWMVTYFMGAEYTGIYGATMQLGLVTAVFSAAIAQSWPPYVLKNWNDKEQFPQIAGRFLVFLYASMAALAILVGMFSREALMLFTPNAYWGAAIIIPIVAVGTAIFSTTQVTMIGLTYSKRSGLILIGVILAGLSNVVGNIMLIPLWGVVGAALSTIIGYTVLTAYYSFWLLKKYPIKVNLKAIILITFCMAAYLLAHHSVEKMMQWSVQCFIAKASFVTLVSGIFIFMRRHQMYALRLRLFS